jgi:hypothetical protein
MKHSVFFAGVVLTVALSNVAFAANPQAPGATQAKPTFASEYDKQLTDIEKEITGAAEAMPEDKFNFAPSGPGDFKGVRTFAMQVKHLATGNYALAAAILQEKAPVPLKGPNGPDSITSRADILKLLADSYVYAHKAVLSITQENILEPIKRPFGEGQTTRLTLATSLLGHPFDHYGQMVIYLRMNGIIPPASRK